MAKKTNKFKDRSVYQQELAERSGFDEYVGLGRPIDVIDDISQRTAVAMALLIISGVSAYKMIHGMTFMDAAFYALGMAMSLIFSFMIGQELDPDRTLGGLIGGFLSAVGYAFFGPSDFVVSIWMLWILRMFTRTSGDRHQIFDNILIIGSAAYMGWRGFYLYPMITGAAYVMESQIAFGYFRSLYLAGVAFAALFFAKFNVQNNGLNVEYIYFLMVVLFLFMPEIRISRFTKAIGDKSFKPISGSRLQVGLGFFLMTIASLTLLHGNEAVRALVPGIMAALGCGANLLRALIMKEVNFEK